jgi:hypothetical protein
MTVTEALILGVSGIAGMAEVQEMLTIFEGQAVSFQIKGYGTVTFAYKGGKLVLEKGQARGVKGAAEVSLLDFLSFINGKREFPGLFTHEFPHYFKATVGEYYDFGGDFMLMGPVFDGLSKLYRMDPGFKAAIDGLGA